MFNGSKRHFWFFSLFLFFILVFLQQAHAGYFNGKTRFYTIKTKHFIIHYPESLEATAEEIRGLCEGVYDRMTARMDWTPRGRTRLILTDKSEAANGLANVLPDNNIVLFVAAPTADSGLDDYKNYYEYLLTHELTHILHIDQYNRTAGPFRVFMGKIVAPNGLTPIWMREGMAVYEESLLEEGYGRNHADATDMTLRTAYYEDHFPRIDQIGGLSAHFPAGAGPYLFGGKFMEWLAQNYGEDRIYQYQKEFASGLWLYSLNNKARRVFGKSFYQLWDEFKEDQFKKFDLTKRAVEDKGVTPLVDFVKNKNRQKDFTMSADGTTYAYAEDSLDESSKIVVGHFGNGDAGQQQKENAQKTLLKKKSLFGQMSLSRDGRWLAYSVRSEIEKKTSLADVFYVDLKTKKSYRVIENQISKKSLHAMDPDFSPADGGARWMVMVRKFQGVDQLYVYDTQNKKGHIITEAPAKTLFSNPRYSPDGEKIAVSAKNPTTGFRDIVIYSKVGEKIAQITNDKAPDLTPIFSPDGSQILFSSSRSGIFNIHSYHLTTGIITPMTNVLTGVFEPMLDATTGTLYVQTYSTRNSYLQKTASDFVGRAPAPLTELLSHYESDLVDKPATQVLPKYHLQDAKKYSPLPDVLQPTYVLPNLLFYESSAYVSATIGRVDPLYRHSWSAFADYRSEAGFVGGGATYVYSRYDPHFYVGALRYVVDWGTLTTASASAHFFEERWQAFTGVSYGFGRQSVSTSYFYENRSALVNLTGLNLINMKPYAGLRFQYQFANYKKFPNSVSQEDGALLRINTDVTDAVLGSDEVNEEIVTVGDLRFYLEMPWSDHHVLAVRALGGWQWGDLQQFGTFRLGGPFGEGTGVVKYSARLFPLRGLAGVSYGGDQAFLFSAEYRLPLVENVNRGLGTGPIFLDNLYLDFFVEGADIKYRSETRLLSSKTLVDVGPELKGDFVFGYGLPVTMRLGYGIILTNRDRLGNLQDPLTGGSIKNGTTYLQAGTSF